MFRGRQEERGRESAMRPQRLRDLDGALVWEQRASMAPERGDKLLSLRHDPVRL
jgi:hypothetical protein